MELIGNSKVTPGAAGTNQSWTLLREDISLENGWQISFKAYRFRETLDCVPDSLLVATKRVFPRVLATSMGPDCVEL